MAKNHDFFKISAKLKKIVNFAEILKKIIIFCQSFEKIIILNVMFVILNGLVSFLAMSFSVV